MIYLNTFTLPPHPEFIDTGRYRSAIPKLEFNAAYPLHVFVKTRLPPLEFGEVTFFTGATARASQRLQGI